jgi:hypothetical protein
MKELKSKKTGRINIVTDEEYNEILASSINMKNFIVTDLRSVKAIIPTLKESPTEVKKIIKKTQNEG